MLAAKIAAQAGDQANGLAQIRRWFKAVSVGIGLQDFDLQIRKHDLGRQLRYFPAQQGHHHDVPGDDHVDGKGTLKPLDALMGQFFNGAATFQYAVPVLDTPA